MITALKYLLWLAHWLLIAVLAAAAGLFVTLPLDEASAGPVSVAVSVAVIWGGYLTSPVPGGIRRPSTATSNSNSNSNSNNPGEPS